MAAMRTALTLKADVSEPRGRTGGREEGNGREGEIEYSRGL